MKEKTRSTGRSVSASKIEERIHRFLRPGALARFRDSRRSSLMGQRGGIFLHGDHGRHQDSLSPLPSSSAVDAEATVTSPPIPAADGLPCFLTGVSGPIFPQRKKLLAAKAMILVPVSPAGQDAADFPSLGAFNPDLLLVH
ncbi:unnamed protein product [Spirodela intermedia]|uniref:Uncharacterized protein n=1 Tax=Spirodela intermedia TaxID=51605 RepID=A0A7I8L730_SPIIN|nr:unnamed protein product [Spirodela intermedia]